MFGMVDEVKFVLDLRQVCLVVFPVLHSLCPQIWLRVS